MVQFDPQTFFLPHNVNRIAVVTNDGELPVPFMDYYSNDQVEFAVFSGGARQVCLQYNAPENRSSREVLTYEVFVHQLMQRNHRFLYDGAFLLFPHKATLLGMQGMLPMMMEVGGVIKMFTGNIEQSRQAAECLNNSHNRGTTFRTYSQLAYPRELGSLGFNMPSVSSAIEVVVAVRES